MDQTVHQHFIGDRLIRNQSRRNARRVDGGLTLRNVKRHNSSTSKNSKNNKAKPNTAIPKHAIHHKTTTPTAKDENPTFRDLGGNWKLLFKDSGDDGGSALQNKASGSSRSLLTTSTHSLVSLSSNDGSQHRKSLGDLTNVLSRRRDRRERRDAVIGSLQSVLGPLTPIGSHGAPLRLDKESMLENIAASALAIVDDAEHENEPTQRERRFKKYALKKAQELDRSSHHETKKKRKKQRKSVMSSLEKILGPEELKKQKKQKKQKTPPPPAPTAPKPVAEQEDEEDKACFAWWEGLKEDDDRTASVGSLTPKRKRSVLVEMSPPGTPSKRTARHIPSAPLTPSKRGARGVLGSPTTPKKRATRHLPSSPLTPTKRSSSVQDEPNTPKKRAARGDTKPCPEVGQWKQLFQKDKKAKKQGTGSSQRNLAEERDDAPATEDPGYGSDTDDAKKRKKRKKSKSVMIAKEPKPTVAETKVQLPPPSSPFKPIIHIAYKDDGSFENFKFRFDEDEVRKQVRAKLREEQMKYAALATLKAKMKSKDHHRPHPRLVMNVSSRNLQLE